MMTRIGNAKVCKNLLFRNIFTHFGVCLDIFHAIIVHDAEIAVPECLRHCQWDFGFGLDYLCPRLPLPSLPVPSLSFPAPMQRPWRGVPPHVLGYILVGIRLIHLEICSDVLPYVYIGYVYGKYFECCPGVKAFAENDL